MKSTKFFFVSTLAFAYLSAGAATQGTLGATSTGSFTNTLDDTFPRQVQILNLQDALVSTSSPQISWGGFPGVLYTTEDNFCVVDTSGGAVQLSFEFATQTDSYNNTYARAASGATKPYRFDVRTLDDVYSGGRIPHATGTYVVPAGKTITAAAGCGSGNMAKRVGVHDFSTTYSADVFIDTVTILVTPQ